MSLYDSDESIQRKNAPTGFTIIETLVCLGVLILLLPMAHHSFSTAWIKYQNLLMKEKAVLMAEMVLSVEETRMLKGPFLFPDDSDMAQDPHLRCSRRLENVSENLKNIKIKVTWESRDGIEQFGLEELVYTRPKNVQKKERDKA